ncbi:hypothetical protein [Acinetobacter sp. BSP-28]|uniref:hypothetical protein n=1 Tax=Acinetobacter sp. BSP-28 TaxID=3344661 RepID=UPI00376FD995
MIYKFYQQHIFPHLLNQVMQTPSLMDQRRELLLPITGEVLEIGFGTGVNLPFYQNVDTLYALEPNADIYQLAIKRVHESAIHVQHLQNLLTPIQKRLADGCHLNRNIEQALLDAHFNFKEKHYLNATGIPKIAQRMLFARAQKQ